MWKEIPRARRVLIALCAVLCLANAAFSFAIASYTSGAMMLLMAPLVVLAFMGDVRRPKPRGFWLLFSGVVVLQILVTVLYVRGSA
jgi:uncharacterized membrane protein HdeD (DUF308 family)